MEVHKVKTDKIFPNPWNPNHIRKSIYLKLKRYIQKEAGTVIPLVVRPHPTKRAGYELIDGYHRWKIYQELKHTEVDVIILKVNDEQAKILSVNLNYMRGSAKPMEYARLIHDLTEKYMLEDLELLLPESKSQLLDKLELLKLPSDLQSNLESEAADKEKETLETIKFQVTPEQKDVIEAALKNSDKKKKGAALAELVKAGSQVIEGSLTT